MVTYVCLRCRENFEPEDASLKCPFCGFRIMAKARPEFKKKVKAR
ncbi:MAG: DNA-directed RNA polymerase subunit P [Candidatus Aenigmatarchaeota archaeon]